MIEANRAVLAERWPELLRWIEEASEPEKAELLRDGPAPALRIGGVQLSSSYDPRAEAEVQAALVPEAADAVTCYGFAGGELPRVLLRRPAVRALTVAVFHPGVARLSFAHFAQSDWLADPRVELVRASDRKGVAKPFAASPVCLRLAEDGAARLRDLIALELAEPYQRAHIARREEELLQRLEESRDLVAADGDVGELFGTRKGATVWVAGAGPTLARHLEKLRDRPADEPLVTVDACLAPLRAAGVRVDAVLTMDSHREHQLPLFDGDLARFAETPLVYLPVVHRDVLARWPGPRLATWFRYPRFARFARENPRAELWSSGSVIHPAVDLATRMGAARVILCGVDLAHVGGRTHVEGSHHVRDHPVGDRLGSWVMNGRGERVPSLPNLIGYLRDLEGYVAAKPSVTFLNTDKDGARIEGTQYVEDVDG